MTATLLLVSVMAMDTVPYARHESSARARGGIRAERERAVWDTL